MASCPATRLGLCLTVFAILIPSAGKAASTTPTEPAAVPIPLDMEESSIPARQAAQMGSLPRFKVFHDFQFSNRLSESGITFQHQIVDDAGLHYKAVHYDHGNGICAADVDGDELIDIYFTTQIGPNELWKNLGGGRFRNITEQAGVAMADVVSVTGSFTDIDNDGDPDLFVTTVKMGNRLFENKGKGRFEDITEQAGVRYVGHSSAGVFFDFDNDGLLDMFLTNIGKYTGDNEGRGGYFIGLDEAFVGHTIPGRNERSILYRNLGLNRFQDVSKEALLMDWSWTGDATPVDVDRDGYQDLYVLNMQGRDHYYQNVKGKFFLDRTDQQFPRTPPGAMGVKAFDWNNDGLVDLMLTDMHSDMGERIGPEREKMKSKVPFAAPAGEVERSIFGNAFFQNTGQGFEEISDWIEVETYWPWGISVDDLNADGWDDIFIPAGMNFPFRYGINSLLLNNRGETFLDSEFILGVEPRTGDLVKPWFEVDCSAGEAELEAALRPMERWIAAGASADGEPTGDEVDARPTACQGQTGKVTVLAALASRGAVIFDLEGDGDLDIVTNEFFDHPQVLVSNLTEKREVHFVRVKLVGTSSNRSGLGARVTVVTASGSQLKVHDGKSGYLSQSLIPLFFGLGDATKIERIEVEWPSGRAQTIHRPATNTLVEIVEPPTPEA